MGKRKTSDEHIVGLPHGKIYYTRSVRIRPESDKWDVEKLHTLRGTPWNLKGEVEADEPRIPECIPFTAPEVEESVENNLPIPEAIPRDFMTTDARLKKYGFSHGCRRCTAMQMGDPDVLRKRHSVECRARIRGELMGDEQDLERTERAEARTTNFQQRQKTDQLAPAEQPPVEAEPSSSSTDPASAKRQKVPAAESEKKMKRRSWTEDNTEHDESSKRLTPSAPEPEQSLLRVDADFDEFEERIPITKEPVVTEQTRMDQWKRTFGDSEEETVEVKRRRTDMAFICDV